LILSGVYHAPAQELEFRNIREISTGQPFSGPYWVTAADFDTDGRPDLAVSEYDGAAVVILPGHGDDTFGAGIRISLRGSVRQISVADFDRDGHPDLVAACSGPGDGGAELNEVVVLMGRGDGTFHDPIQIRVRSEPWGIAATDLDGDGVPDVAVGQPGKILLLTGNGDGTFRDPVEAPTPYQEYGSNGPVTAIQAADFNLDGKPDLVAVHRASGSLSLLVSSPGGYQGQVLVADIGYAYDVTVADFDRDGKPDVAVAGDYGGLALLGSGEGTFRRTAVVEESARPIAIGTGDFDGDGVPDLVLGNYYGGKISVLLGGGDGTFRQVAPLNAKGDTYAIAVVDLNGDGKPDFVGANHSSDSLTVALGKSEGKFERPRTLASSHGAVAAADLDTDGRMDLVVVNDAADTVDVLRGAALPADC
jgi:hypothetical protein